MTKNENPVLCGGTFFALMLNARGQRTAKRDNALSKTDGLSQPELLVELVKIIKPTFNPPISEATLKKNVTDYKLCENNGGTYFATVFESNDVDAFESRIKSDYNSVLADMTALLIRFVGEDKVEWLVKALIEAIKCDSNIPNTAELFICDENPITKAELKNINNVSLPSFTLGIWRYIVTNVKDNTVGKHTFDRWHSKKGDANSEWIFRSDIGSGVNWEINISPLFENASDSSAEAPFAPAEEQTTEQEEPYIFEETAEQSASPANQVVINGNVFNAKNQFFGNVENVITS